MTTRRFYVDKRFPVRNGLRVLSIHPLERDMDKDRLECLWACGDANAGNTLAYGIQNDWFEDRNYVRATAIQQLLANRGDVLAMNNLAFSYIYGIGTRKNLRLAMLWLGKAAAAGFHSSITNYAYETLIVGNPYGDIELAKLYLMESIKHGYDDEWKSLYTLM